MLVKKGNPRRVKCNLACRVVPRIVPSMGLFRRSVKEFEVKAACVE